jgi:hypothetical protein
VALSSLRFAAELSGLNLKTAFTRAKTQRALRNSNTYRYRKSNQYVEKLEPDNWLIFLCACALKRSGAQVRSWRALRETAFSGLKGIEVRRRIQADRAKGLTDQMGTY